MKYSRPGVVVVDFPINLHDFINVAKYSEFNSFVVSISNAKWYMENDFALPSESERENIIKNSATNISGLDYSDWVNQIMILLNQYDCDSSYENVRRKAESQLKKDLKYAEELVESGSIMIRLTSIRNTNLARLIKQQRSKDFLALVPLYNGNLCNDSWLWWDNFRSVFGHSKNLSVVLELHPKKMPPQSIVDRWLSEPVEAIIVPSTLFQYEDECKPILSTEWKSIVDRFIKAKANTIFQDPPKNTDCIIYSKFFQDMYYRIQYTDEYGVDMFEDDIFGVPLRTICDNMPLGFYMGLEQDTVKYDLYIEAITQALRDNIPESEIAVVMVLGAGHGLLVDIVLKAAERVKRDLRVYVVERSKGAVRTLQHVISNLWPHKNITIYCKKMDEFSPCERADIIVSELVGTLGDNELTPEHHECAMRLLKPNGICIPQSSTSFINPVMAPRYQYLADEAVKTFYSRKPHVNPSESNFLGIMKSTYHLGDPQILFKFNHPCSSSDGDYRRVKVLKFKAPSDGVMNGLVGYFEVCLYKDIKFSINRLTRTPFLQSFFPLYFPFSKPIRIKEGNNIEICFWRCRDNNKVWYEWCCMSPAMTHIHNFRGRWNTIYLK